MNQRILVTGVAGMIGSHLLDALLSRGYDVIGVDDFSFGRHENIARHADNERFEFHRASVMDGDVMQTLTQGVDVVVHLAAVKKIAENDSAMATLKVNTHGCEHVFAAAHHAGAKLVFASTSDVYGMSPDLPFREDGDLLIGPSMIKRWSYAVSKLYGEQLAFAYHSDYGLPVVVLRYFGGFSPRSSFSWSGGHIPIFIRAILDDQDVIIHGDGSQTRSMAYVDDLVRGTVMAMESPKAVGEVINLGNDEELSVLDAAHMIHRIANTGHTLKVRLTPFSDVFGNYKDIARRVPDLTKAQNLLGYAPQVSTEDGISRTIAEARRS